MLVEPVHRLALAGLVAGAGHVDAAEVHLVAALADRELDRPPAEQVKRAGVVAPAPSWSPEWTVERPAVAVQQQAGEQVAVGPVAGLEVDEVPGALRGRHQATNDSRGPNEKWRRSPVSSSRS